MSDMIEVSAPIRSHHEPADAGWVRYFFGCIMGLVGFCSVLWLAS